MKHNFYPAMVLLAGAVVSFHYSVIAKTTGCPVVIAEGQSQTGKSTALQVALGLFGENNFNIAYVH